MLCLNEKRGMETIIMKELKESKFGMALANLEERRQ